SSVAFGKYDVTWSSNWRPQRGTDDPLCTVALRRHVGVRPHLSERIGPPIVLTSSGKEGRQLASQHKPNFLRVRDENNFCGHGARLRLDDCNGGHDGHWL